MINLNHFSQQNIDLIFSIAEITAFHEVIGFLPPTASRRIQLERPQEIRRLFEMRPNGINFVDQIFHTDNIVFP